MAVSPLVIPQALTKLCEGVVVDSTNIATAQTLFTVPNGMKVVVAGYTFKDPSATMSALCAFTTGFGAALQATNVLASSVLSVALVVGSYQLMFVGNVGTQGVAGTVASALLPAAAGGAAYGLSAQNHNILFTVSGTATKVKVDVWGYLDYT